MGNFYTLRKAYEAMISEAAESEEEGAEQFDKNDPLSPELPDPDSEEEINEDLAMKLSDPVRIEIANTMNKVTKIVNAIVNDQKATKETLDKLNKNMSILRSLFDIAEDSADK